MKYGFGVIVALCLLVGLCACGEGVVEVTTVEVTTTVTTTEATTTEVSTMKAIAEPFEDSTKQRIHKSLPEFTFELRGYARQIDRWPDMEYAEVRAVEISGPNGQFHHLFDELDIKVDMPIYKHQVNLSFADYNNDGYLDLRLLLVADRNTSYSLFWLWDVKQQRFIENEQLRNLSYGCSLHVDDDGKLIGSNTAGGGIGWGYTVYTYKNGEFIAIEIRNWLVEPEETIKVSTYKLINGEMVLVSTELEDRQ